MRTILVLTLVLLGGCSALDRQELTSFEPLPNKKFRYEAKTDAIYRHDTAAGERTRLSWLEKYLRDNQLCSGGYVIEQRKAVLIRRAALAQLYNIIYYGRCK